jgi:hypothetical protein
LELLRPYQVGVHNSETEAVMFDLTCKINTYDPVMGTNVLHGHLLYHSQTKEDLDLLKLFLELGADPDAPFSKKWESKSKGIDAAAKLDGGNALHFAVHRDLPDAVAMLLDVGVNTKRTTKDGNTPFDLSVNGSEVKKMVRCIRNSTTLQASYFTSTAVPPCKTYLLEFLTAFPCESSGDPYLSLLP